MNLLKRIISVFIVTVQIICAVPAFATGQANLSNVSPKVSCFKEYDLINILGITKGCDEIFDTDDFVTRENLAVLLYNILNDVPYVAEPGKIKDMDATMPSYSAVCYIVDLGIMSLTADGKFVPDFYVTNDELLKTLVLAGGYAPVISSQSDYIKYAVDMDIADSMGATSDQRVSSTTVTKVLYDFLFADIMIQKPSGSGVELVVDSDTNLLAKNFDVYEFKGVVESNNDVRLAAKNYAGTDRVMIDGKSYNAGKTAAQQYVGYKTDGFYRHGDDDEDTIILIYKDVDAILTVNAEDLPENPLSGRTYSYFNDKKLKNADVSLKATYIRNGSAINYDSSGAGMYPENGWIDFVETDSASDGYDTVIIYDFENYVVDMYLPSEGYVVTKYDKQNFDLSDESITYNYFDKNSVSIEQPVFKGWNVLSVMLNSDGSVVNVYLSEDKVSGKIDGISTKNGKKYYTVNGKEYQLSSDFPTSEASKRSIGDMGEFYLDIRGRIAAFKDGDSIYQFGYFLRGWLSDDMETYSLRILNHEGAEVTLAFADTIRIDGYACRKDGNLKSGDAVEGYTNMGSKLMNDGKQLVRYRTNNDGELIFVDTIYQGTSESEYSLKCTYNTGTSTVPYYNQQFNGRAALNTDTIIFDIPKNAEEDCRTIQYTTFSNDSYYPVKAYSIDDGMIFSDVILTTTNTSIKSKYANPALVTDIYTGINTDGDIVDVVTAYRNGKYVTYYTTVEGLAASEGIGIGDYALLSFNRTDEIDGAVIVYDFDTDVFELPSDSTVADNNTYSSKSRYVAGYVYQKEGSMLKIAKCDVDDLDEFPGNGAEWEYVNVGTCKTVLGKGNENRFFSEVISTAGIKDYKSYGNEAHFIVYQQKTGVPQLMALYER